MSFEQLAGLIPELVRVERGSGSRVLQLPEGLYALLAVRRGHVEIRAAGAEAGPFICAQGYAFHPAQEPYRIAAPKTKEADYTLLFYRMLPAEADWSLAGPLQAVSETKIRYMLDELEQMTAPDDADRERQAAYRCKRRMMLERVLYIYLYESVIMPADAPSVDSLAETLTYLNEHYMLKLTLPMLARRAGMSEGHYTVLFKRLTGTTMTAYLRSLRIEKAKAMFRETQLSAKEIAQRVGFADYFHFSRVFKQEAGCSPLMFKQRCEPNLKIRHAES